MMRIGAGRVVTVLSMFVAWAIAPCTANAAAPESTEFKASSALAEYVAKPDASYQWVKRQEGALGKGKYVELILTSQTWHNTVWNHQLYIYLPEKVGDHSQGLLLIEGGSWNDSLAAPPKGDEKLPTAAVLIATVGDHTQSPVAVLRQVPQQPIFGGLKEDGAISYTFQKFLETGDQDWPLLLPMVKSAVRGMDAVQEFARDTWKLEIKHFLVSGASKRGWTTWLTAAVDPRVNALAPMVIDMLNMPRQIPLQLLSFGGYSERIHEYTDKGLQKYLLTPEGGALRKIVDPYSYRTQLKQPKLVILGTNDPYWPVDALNMYWDGLVGEKHILYVPNGQHGLQDYPRMIGSIAALHQCVANGHKLPKLDWNYEDTNDGVRLTVSCDVEPKSVAVWTTDASSRDFRQSRWVENPAISNGNDGKAFAVELPKPQTGFSAVFAEAHFNGLSIPYSFSTTIRVLPGIGSK
ncbi:MAG: PhoPQ-activated pathogenicity protein [Pirellulales bacterium]|nr:PhoPQ-activated pathogenicity protein [Pirellulales bacterium]